jgi:hypothetical protein
MRLRRQGALVEFVLTSDLDWRSEYCAENFLSIAALFSVKPTIFLTHRSAAIARAAHEGRIEVGIHPHCPPGSSQGHSVEGIIELVLELAPEAIAVRCHRHFTNPEIEFALTARGLRIDGVTCRHLARDLEPIALQSGLLQLPVFFGETRRFDYHLPEFFGPGLEVLNFHPFLNALKAPVGDCYLRHKHHIPTLTADDAREFRHEGDGIATFLIEAIRASREHGHPFVTLTEMAERLSENGV